MNENIFFDIYNGGASLPGTGDTYAGVDICNLCPTLVWMKPEK